ncbi:MAG: maleylpyruvate isomerase N-terminal domain-containing protein [Acidobacteria bacterium]|nr:maleylpyruvate isomerase N-terminal domain-containing protein [Acidobacteriota bacterium]MBV9478599.1 maleylpyruvate isomerase N-terminal domain-containing protein [Acidobacteriota bacterium]
MHEVEPILVAERFAPLDAALLALLRSLTPDEWHAPTVAGAWTVTDVAAHLLDTALRRLSLQRDGYLRPVDINDLATFVNGINADWVSVARRISPAILIELLATYGAQLTHYLSSLDPFAEAQWSVSWAGESTSRQWLDTARELTERWHHQQQIRDATHREPLYEGFLEPVLDTFVRAMPYTLRDVDAPEGTSVTLRVTGVVDRAWTAVREAQWTLYAGAASATCTVTLDADRAWRLFTRQRIARDAQVDGDPSLASPILTMVSVI